MKKISATLVKNLREKTGLGMMDCKKALLISNGDLDLALEELRKSSGLKANKKAGRPTGDGIISTFLNESLACMVEVNCETDFVVKDESFVSYTKDVIGKLVSNVDLTLEEAMEGELEEKRKELVHTLGENIVVRRFARSKEHSDSIGLYLHTNKKIACIVSLEGGNNTLAKDIAMHVAATDPVSITPGDIPKTLMEEEKEILEAKSIDANKSPDLIKKIVDGKLKKFIKEVCLTEQGFVRDPETKIKDLLNENSSKVISFDRFLVGEGVENEKKDFASEVMSQLKNT